MAQVKVWNENTYDFKQEVKGVQLVIPAKGFIEMDYEEAVDFKGMYSPLPPADFSGDHALYYKMIRVESPKAPVFKDEGLTNHLTGARAASPEDLVQALASVRHLLVRDAEAERASAPSSELEDLKRQVAELSALIQDLTPAEKRGPGRPRKEA